jgi:flagellar biosynthesis/type III secretory pathway M-ring protein FliF/YscJ
MSASDWIWIGIVAVVIVGLLVLLNQITKPYDVKTEEEFQQRKQMGARTAGVMGLQQILDPAAKKSVEVQQDLRRGIYDDKEEADDPPEAGEE